MLCYVRWAVLGGIEGFRLPSVRYGLLHRLAASARAHDVAVLAFGLSDREVRFVLEGEEDDLTDVLRGAKGGTLRSARTWGHDLLWGPTRRREIPASGLTDAIVACHTVGGEEDPLISPWTSHRDLLGFRRAAFFDPRPLRRRVDHRVVHARCGGAPLPDGQGVPDAAELGHLLRVAAAILGVLPANRRSFRLFVHAARACGWSTNELARALMVTGRRIRQLAADEEPLLPLALAHLADHRLAHVP